MLNEIKTPEDIFRIIDEYGFLPFFKCTIPGFSIEENTDKELLWGKGTYGPWEWKGPTVRTGKYAYGKFFAGKAGYVSLEMLPELANYRRDGYDFDARFDDGLATVKEKQMYDTVMNRRAVMSKELRRLLGVGKETNSGFEQTVTRLQMQTYICVSDFVYNIDSSGREWGWGVSQYSTPEEMYGDCVSSAYSRKPEESLAIMCGRIAHMFPEATEKQITGLLKRK